MLTSLSESTNAKILEVPQLVLAFRMDSSSRAFPTPCPLLSSQTDTFVMKAARSSPCSTTRSWQAGRMTKPAEKAAHRMTGKDVGGCKA